MKFLVAAPQIAISRLKDIPYTYTLIAMIRFLSNPNISRYFEDAYKVLTQNCLHAINTCREQKAFARTVAKLVSPSGLKEAMSKNSACEKFAVAIKTPKNRGSKRH